MADWPVDGNVMFSDNCGIADAELDRPRPSFQEEYLSASQPITAVNEPETDW